MMQNSLSLSSSTIRSLDLMETPPSANAERDSSEHIGTQARKRQRRDRESVSMNLSSLVVEDDYVSGTSKLEMLFENSEAEAVAQAGTPNPLRSDFRSRTRPGALMRVYSLPSDETGLQADPMREICLLASKLNSRLRPSEIAVSDSTSFDKSSGETLVPRYALVWERPETAVQLVPEVKDAPVDIIWASAWMYQLLRCYEVFHEMGLPYMNVLNPSSILYGGIAGMERVVESLSLNSHVVSRFARISTKITRIGGNKSMPYCGRCHCPPEYLLGQGSRTPAMDMWAFGCLLFELACLGEPFSGQTMQHYSDFAQMLEIFSRMGTPTEESWPGVSKNRYFTKKLPQWPKPVHWFGHNLRGDASTLDLIKNLVVLEPSTRISAKEALAHSFFDPLRQICFEKGIPWKPLDTSSVYQTLLQWQSINVPRTHIMQEDITPSMRSILVDWIVDVVDEFKISSEVLFVTVSIVDMMMKKIQIPRVFFQLLGEASLLVATKIVGSTAVSLSELAFISDGIYEPDDVGRMEQIVFRAIEFQPLAVTSLHFLRVFLASVCADEATKTFAEYLLELCLVEGSHRHFSAEMLALSSVTLAITKGDEYRIPVPRLMSFCKDYATLNRCVEYFKVILKHSSSPRPSALALNAVHSRYRLVSQRLRKSAGSLMSLSAPGGIACDSFSDDPLSVFPEAIVRDVLRFFSVMELARLAPVCAGWRHAMLDPLLWRRLDFSGRHLSPSITYLTSRCILLQSLDISGSTISTLQLTSLLSCCKRLQTLVLEFVVGLDEPSDTSLPHCPTVTKLSLRDAKNLSDVLVVQLLGVVSKATHLNLSSLTSSSILQDDLSRAICKLPLSHLYLNNCTWATDSVLRDVSGCCHDLAVLEVNMCGTISDAGVLALTSRCKELKEIGLCMNPQLSDAAVDAIASNCMHLESLELAFAVQISDDAVCALAQCSNLRVLNLCRVSRITDRSICRIARSCPDLHILNLRMCSQVGDASANSLIQHCPKLRVLHLFSCSQLLVDVLHDLHCTVICHGQP